MDIRGSVILKMAMALLLLVGVDVRASNAMAAEGQSPSKDRLQKADRGTLRHIKNGSSYGRGYDGYESGQPHYGAVALGFHADGVSHDRRPGRYVNGFPVYIYPLSTARKIQSGSDFEQFQQLEEEVSAPDGGRNFMTSGNHCSTPVIICTLYIPGLTGGGCSCRIEGGRSRGQVTE